MWNERGLTGVLAEILSRWEIPGMAVGVVSANEVLFTRCFGVQSLATMQPVTPESIFCVASVSKSFTASAVMQLAERGLVDLDAPVNLYLPYFQIGAERCARITPRQILSHTSGMPDMDEGEYDLLVAHPEWDDGAAERYVRGLSGRKMAADPGERFLYSNIAYNVLGDLIAKVSGMPFETYLKTCVLAPARMPQSTFCFAEVPRDRLAVPHIRIPDRIVRPIYPYHRADAPASFLHSSLTDMCRWLMACLNQGSLGGRQILSPASLEQMWQPAARWGYPPLYEDMGLGWTLGHYHGAKTASHGGMGFGWTDFMVVLPERNRAAVILCNEESFARGRTVGAVLDVILGLEPQAGSVSWMVPVCQALRSGGMDAAYACYEALKGGAENYEIAEDDLINLAIQIETAKKYDLAAAVLELNLRAFPQSHETLSRLARLKQSDGPYPRQL
jgi:CubicO group peptidase (beta-lactamase class C family)